MNAPTPLDRLDLIDRLNAKEEQARALLLAMSLGFPALNESLSAAYVQTILDLLTDLHQTTRALVPGLDSKEVQA